MRKSFIAGNWKMYKTKAQAETFANEFKKICKTEAVDVAICAPFTDLASLIDLLKDTDIKVGAQNVHFEDDGAFTGEISVHMLKEIGVLYCIVGHSERRQYFAETDATVNKKLHKLFTTDIVPIMCVGERLEDREAGNEFKLVESQLVKGLSCIEREDAEKLVIAYEPIWAIGTGKTATPEQAEEMCAFIRKTLEKIYDAKTAHSIIIQYGGSVKPQNASKIMSMPNIDGALVGGASLEPDEFIKIVNFK